MSKDILYRLREADAWMRGLANVPEWDNQPTLLMQAVEEIKLQRNLNSALAAVIEQLRTENQRLEAVLMSSPDLYDAAYGHGAWEEDIGFE